MSDWAQVAVAFLAAVSSIASAYFASRSARRAHRSAERAIEASLRPPPES